MDRRRTVLDSYAAMNRGDFESLRAVYTDDIVYDLTDLPESTVHEGIDQVIAFLYTISDALAGVRNEIESVAVDGD